MIMSFSQYKRLFYVLFLPLLILGIVTSYFLISKDNYDWFSCEPSGSGEFCRPIGGIDWPGRSAFRERYPAWFDIYPAKNSKLINANIEGAERVLRGVTISGVESAFKSHGDPSNLIGKKGAIVLGIRDPGSKSVILGDGSFLLYCNSLSFNEGGKSYRSRCFGDGWSALIKYSVSGGDVDGLSALESALSEAINNEERGIIIAWTLITPIFIALFAILSLVIYIVQRAYKYVKG